MALPFLKLTIDPSGPIVSINLRQVSYFKASGTKTVVQMCDGGAAFIVVESLSAIAMAAQNEVVTINP